MLAKHSEKVESFKRWFRELDVGFETVGSVPSFSPEVGDTAMHAYRILPRL